MPRRAKVLLLDIETAPSLGWVWKMYEANVLALERDWFMLCFSYQWLGEKRARNRALPDYPRLYAKDKSNDRDLVRDLWKLLDEADVVVAHNGDAFDLRKSNARLVYHKLPPPRPYKTVDTLKIARRFFAFSSNKLDDLGAYLGVGRKVRHSGMHLWFGCMSGDRKSWALMSRYCNGDVELLGRVYDRLKGWSTNHPDLTMYSREDTCPVCESYNVKRNGFRVTRGGKRQERQCQDCGHYFKSGPLIKLPRAWAS